MDPKPKNATQPFVSYTNKAVTKESERDFLSLLTASFFVSCMLDPPFIVYVAASCHCYNLSQSRVVHVSSRYLFLVPRFSFPLSIQSSTSFRSSPSASASVDQKHSETFNKFETNTRTKTTTTTATKTTKTNTRDKLTTTATIQDYAMVDGFIFDINAESEDDTSYDAPPRTTPRGTEMLFYSSGEAESRIDIRSLSTRLRRRGR